MDLETYSNTLSAFIAGSYITSALTLGKELGLFDELEKPVSAHQLADTCNLKERYVREWLGCMASTSIVSIDEKDHYFIPHSLKLGLHVVDCAFFFPVMATLTKKVANCFRKDGPRGYSYDEMPPEVIDVLEEKIPDVDKAVEQLIVPIMDFKGDVQTSLARLFA